MNERVNKQRSCMVLIIIAKSIILVDRVISAKTSLG